MLKTQQTMKSAQLKYENTKEYSKIFDLINREVYDHIINNKINFCDSRNHVICIYYMNISNFHLITYIMKILYLNLMMVFTKCLERVFKFQYGPISFKEKKCS